MKIYTFEIETPSGSVTVWNTKALTRVDAWRLVAIRFGHSAICIRIVTP